LPRIKYTDPNDPTNTTVTWPVRWEFSGCALSYCEISDPTLQHYSRVRHLGYKLIETFYRRFWFNYDNDPITWYYQASILHINPANKLEFIERKLYLPNIASLFWSSAIKDSERFFLQENR
jgi:hypothetical protein